MMDLNQRRDTQTTEARPRCMVPQTMNLISLMPENKKDFCVLQNVRPVAPDIWEIEERETVNLYPLLSYFKQFWEQVQEVPVPAGKDCPQPCVQESSHFNPSISEPTVDGVGHFTEMPSLWEKQNSFEYETLKKEIFIRFLFWILKVLFQRVHVVFYIEGKNGILQIFADEKPFVKIIFNDCPLKTHLN